MAETQEQRQERLANARAAKAAKKITDAQTAATAAPDKINQALMDRIAALEGKFASGTVLPIPGEPLTARRPGSYVIIGREPITGNPVYQKVRWTKKDLEETYPMVEYTPPRTMDVAPHGVRYSLQADVEVLIPNIVKQVMQQSLAAEKRMNDILNTPIGLEEIGRMDATARRQPGIPVPSRVTIVGHGLNLGGEMEMISQNDSRGEVLTVNSPNPEKK